MMRLPFVLSALAALSLPAIAAEDPIVARQALMSSNGGAAAVAAAMLKGEIPYNPVVARSALVSLAATAAVFGDYFPEGSDDPARSKASPKIWQDRAGFDAELTKFQTGTARAVEAAGRDGPADSAAFQAAVLPVFDSCKTCHESYQIPPD